jgi:hypothetical protein
MKDLGTLEKGCFMKDLGSLEKGCFMDLLIVGSIYERF